MKFRDIDTNKLKYQPVDSSDAHHWLKCDQLEEGFISLQMHHQTGVDLYRLTIQISDDPAPRIRIAAELWNNELLAEMKKEQGCKTRDVALATKRTPSSDGTKDLSCEAYIDFDQTPASQARARSFLTTLMNQTKLPCFRTQSQKDQSLSTISKQIDLLAKQHLAGNCCLGTDWVKTANQDQEALKKADARWKETKTDLMCCGFFALEVACIAAGVAALSTISLSIP